MTSSLQRVGSGGQGLASVGLTGVLGRCLPEKPVWWGLGGSRLVGVLGLAPPCCPSWWGLGRAGLVGVLGLAPSSGPSWWSLGRASRLVAAVLASARFCALGPALWGFLRCEEVLTRVFFASGLRLTGGRVPLGPSCLAGGAVHATLLQGPDSAACCLHPARPFGGAAALRQGGPWNLGSFLSLPGAFGSRTAS